MIIEVKKEGQFVPSYGGNDKAAEKDQIKVYHRYLQPGERKKYLFTRPIVMDTMSGEIDSKVEYVQDMEGIAKSIITKIENLSVKVDGKEVKIDTADKLYNTSGVPYKLVQEIELYMFTASPEVDADFL